MVVGDTGLRERACKRRRGFSLVEVLTVIGIIMIMIALLIPTIKKAREQAVVTQCAANLHSISIAFNTYLVESRGAVFWRVHPQRTNGMDWCAWGGREDNLNHAQDELFNKIHPRPLNPYVSNKIDVFHCPSDEMPTQFWHDAMQNDHTRWEDVGNSYHFNADGYPPTPSDPTTGERPEGHGLAGKKITEVSDSARTVLFYDACILPQWFVHWHPHYHANFCMVDGHVVFTKWPTDQPGEEYLWN
jgi:prepilin-type processing-associated H-X9-DG protein